jgi:hypothetical protein
LFRERIGTDLIESLGLDKKNPAGTDKVEYWHKVYDAFFPGAAEQQPVSPCMSLLHGTVILSANYFGDYEGPAAEHLHRFLRFTEQEMPRLLPILQSRLGSQDFSSWSYQLRLQQEIQQEAGRLFLGYISDTVMPHLGQRYDKRQTECAAQEVSDPGAIDQLSSTVPNAQPAGNEDLPSMRVEDDCVVVSQLGRMDSTRQPLPESQGTTPNLSSAHDSDEIAESDPSASSSAPRSGGGLSDLEAATIPTSEAELESIFRRCSHVDWSEELDPDFNEFLEPPSAEVNW